MADTTTQPVVQQGPDQKWYKVKPSDQKSFDAHFTKQGWIKKTDGWYTQTGEKAIKSVPSGTPAFNIKRGPSGLGVGGPSVGVSLQDKRKDLQSSGARDFTGAAMGDVGGAIGGTVGGVPGATMGGAVGQVINNIISRPSFLEADPTFKKQVTNVILEAGKQAVYEKGGQLAAKPVERFVGYLFNKLPRATMKEGIRFLPSEYKPGGAVYKYVEDLFTNLYSSKGIMDEFKEKQFQEISNKMSDVVNGLTKVNGTSEDMGHILQQTMAAGHKAINKQLDAMYAANIAKGMAKDKAEQAVRASKLGQEATKRFDNELTQKILSTNKPELIAGWLVSGTKFSNAEERLLQDTLKHMESPVYKRVEKQIISDIWWDTIRGATDPTLKQAGGGKYAGNLFISNMDKIGESKLKSVLEPETYKNLEDFAKLTKTIGGTGNASGVGRFLNLALLVPFRAGLKFDAFTKTAGTAFVINRLAKLITSTEGIKLSENYARALAANTPRLIDASVQEIRKFNQRSDEEYDLEQKQVDEDIKKITGGNK